MSQENYNYKQKFVEINKLIQVNNLLSGRNRNIVKNMIEDLSQKYKTVIDSNDIEKKIVEVNDKIKNVINSNSKI